MSEPHETLWAINIADVVLVAAILLLAVAGRFMFSSHSKTTFDDDEEYGPGDFDAAYHAHQQQSDRYPD